ncbi:MAG TPA: hypothetical protein VF765_30945 [Polyangiaceae bacterium]
MAEGAEVIPLRKCRQCGAPGKPLELLLPGGVLKVDACDPCLARAQAKLDRLKPVDEAMLAAGVPDDVRGETITFLLARLPR